MDDTQIKDAERANSFHLDTYCFDSSSENWLFSDLLRQQRVKKIYFTGMLTHGQSDFFIQTSVQIHAPCAATTRTSSSSARSRRQPEVRDRLWRVNTNCNNPV